MPTKTPDFNKLSFTQRAIVRWAKWIRDNPPDQRVPKKKYNIRDILMTMPNKNGYYTPPYE
jgi:hypothetical protein